MSTINSVNFLGFDRNQKIRQKDILRIVADVDDYDGMIDEEIVPNLIRQIIAWVSNRSAVRLSDAAWSGQAYESIHGGLYSAAIRLDIDSGYVWALRCDDPDKVVPGRIWSTEVSVRCINGHSPRVAVRSIVNFKGDSSDIVPHVPGFVRQLCDRVGLLCGQYRILTDFFEISNDLQAEEFVEDLLDDQRILPVIVFSGYEGEGGENKYSIDENDIRNLSISLSSVAHVLLIPYKYTWMITDRFGKHLSVFSGAARIYYPGFGEDSNPYEHDLFFGQNLSEKPQFFTDQMRKIIASYSVRRNPIGINIIPFSEIREKYFEIQKGSLSRSSDEYIELLEDEIEVLRKNIEQTEQEKDQLLNDLENELQKNENLEKKEFYLKSLNERMKDKIIELGAKIDDNISYPESWEKFEEWCLEFFEGRIILSSKARAGLKRAKFENIRMAADCIKWLANDYRDGRISGNIDFKEYRIEPNLLNSLCGGDEFEFQMYGKKYTADWHIKSGGGTRDPKRCLRIYYCWEDKLQQVIVADMPGHIDNAIS